MELLSDDKISAYPLRPVTNATDENDNDDDEQTTARAESDVSFRIVRWSVGILARTNPVIRRINVQVFA